MSVSQTAEYALRAVIRLAQHPGEAQTTQQLAESTLVPQSYLPKVLQPLTRAGIVTAQRGSHGGYTLDRDADELSVLDVVNCVDPVKRIEHCPGSRASSDDLCALHQMLDDELAETQRRYGETTIASLLHLPNNVPPLCISSQHFSGCSSPGVATAKQATATSTSLAE